MVWPLLPLLLACGSGSTDDDDARQYVAALAQIDASEKQPREKREDALLSALARCASLESKQLHGDCGLAAIQSLAAQTNHATNALLAQCEALPTPLNQAECAFQVGEQRDDAAACKASGPFADDCRMHLFSRRVAKIDADQETLGEALETLAAQLSFDASDPRPWIAASRWWLGQSTPLDRSRCTALQKDDRATDREQLCREAGAQLYNDRLNHARDTGTYPCGGGELPATLQTAPDPQLEQIRLDREKGDLCP